MGDRGDRHARGLRPAGHRLRAPRAPLLLARPGPRHLGQPARRGRGPRRALAEVGAEAQAAGQDAGRLQGQKGEGKKSLRKARRSIKQAKKKGFRLLPSRNKKELSKKKAKRLMKINRKLAERCKFKTVQKAINKSGNNDRVVIMPGKYKEKPSRNAADQRPQVRRSDAGGPKRRRDPQLPRTRSPAPTTRT